MQKEGKGTPRNLCCVAATLLKVTPAWQKFMAVYVRETHLKRQRRGLLGGTDKAEKRFVCACNETVNDTEFSVKNMTPLVVKNSVFSVFSHIFDGI